MWQNTRYIYKRNRAHKVSPHTPALARTYANIESPHKVCMIRFYLTYRSFTDRLNPETERPDHRARAKVQAAKREDEFKARIIFFLGLKVDTAPGSERPGAFPKREIRHDDLPGWKHLYHFLPKTLSITKPHNAPPHHHTTLAPFSSAGLVGA